MIKPLNNNVLLKKETIENKTASGIILSTSEKDQENIGRVIAVGEGKLVDGERIAVSVKEGDRVIYDKYASQQFEYQDEKYILVEDEKILAVIE